MATLVNLTGYQHGIENDEVGINIESFSVDYEPEFKEKLVNKNNEVRGFAVGPVQRTATVEGEVAGATGLMAATFVAAVTLANDTSTFGGSGGFYLDRVTESQSRSGFRRVSMTLSSNAGVS